jgi:hypothetical protein
MMLHAVAALLGIFPSVPARVVDKPLAAYVVMGDGGAAVARVVTTDATCPSIKINGRLRAMSLRARPVTEAQRPTASKPEASKPSAFPVTACEAKLPRGAKRASVLGLRLPVPHRRVNRILVIGDTGCRLKASDNAYQRCNRQAEWPFAKIAALGAGWKPDLIIHVGDYHYRESPCPETIAQTGCQGSPWGYGWDAWNADWFVPAAPLFAAAPLVLARGNHENCFRAGQGWFRFLDPMPPTETRSCNDPANDLEGDHSAPYAVPLGGGTQIVVMDMANAPNTAMDHADPRAAQLRADYDALALLAKGARSTLMVTHKPVLGFGGQTSGGKVALFPGNPAIQSAFAAENPAMFPSGVDVLLAGHVHLWEQVSFETAFPSQFIAGFSGTQEETVPLPVRPPADFTPAPGAVIDAFSSWTEGFGYMTLERRGPRRWAVTVWNVEGQVANRCRVEGRKSVCARAKVT